MRFRLCRVPTLGQREDVLLGSRGNGLAELCDLGVANLEVVHLLDEPDTVSEPKLIGNQCRSHTS